MTQSKKPNRKIAETPKSPRRKAAARDRYLAEFRRELALERFQSERPQLWLQSQRVSKLVEIQEQLDDDAFPEGSCFLHASVVGAQTFAVKRVTGIDLDTCQVTLEIHGDEDLESGIVVLPLEAIEWFGFPAKAVPIGVHFEGFTGWSGGRGGERGGHHHVASGTPAPAAQLPLSTAPPSRRS